MHQVAYAKALEQLTGVEVPKMLDVPQIPNDKFPETREWQEQGLHRILYRFSPDAYEDAGQVWTGQHPLDGEDLEFVDGPPEGAPLPSSRPSPRSACPASIQARSASSPRSSWRARASEGPRRGGCGRPAFPDRR